ncbi:DUF4123 domain-containing protein [Aerolutibacter ruishenii]|uniref:Uncharacterized protein DUF4123 n=1 Tax=Aerolutibacter ruishenii TaxID=686800 RepID=A0A562M0D6_9GAMM|nr:DUF4123 domain-containing protein [Lysobacter ruishenii]TWI13379.1 uncharacterized protein DUF4123 [Lysobacter ruishenii]
MNPLPEIWNTRAESVIRHFVLMDGAMQRELGKALSANRYDGNSLFEGDSPEAKALGPWLLSAQQAQDAGVDGIARGITWLDGKLELSQAIVHLRSWMIGPLPDGVARGYLRLGDGRVLRAMLEIWSPNQRAAFLAPWQRICCADRDGEAWMTPVLSPAETGSIPRGGVSARLSDIQYRLLLDSSVPDQLLHELKRHVKPHSSLSSREQRHVEAVRTLEVAKELGYSATGDWMSLIGGAVRQGKGAAQALRFHPEVQAGRTGADLWHAVMADDRWPRWRTGSEDGHESEEHGSTMQEIDG